MFGPSAQIVFGQGEADVRGRHDLDRLAVDPDKRGAQGFVAGQEAIERGAQGLAMEWPLKVQSGGQVVSRAGGRVELIGPLAVAPRIRIPDLRLEGALG